MTVRPRGRSSSGTSAAERCELDGEVEGAVAAQELHSSAGYTGGLGAEGGGELALEPEPGMLVHHRGEQVGGQLPGAQAGDVDTRAGGQQVGHRPVRQGNAGAAVQRDGGAHRVGGGRGQADVLGDVAGDAGAAAGEVDVLIAGGQAGVVQQARLVPPSSALTRAAVEQAQRRLSPALLNHSYRTYAFGAALGALEGLTVDTELLFAAAGA